MDRCPTCGAAVRPGAKFCTSCGTRLSEHVSGKSSESTWGSVPDTQASTPTATGEQSTDEAVATPEPDWGQAVEDTAGDESQQATTAETTTDTDWPTSETATETTDEKEEIPPNEGTSWSSNWPGSETGITATSTDSPASRFETGLEDSATPESTDEQPDAEVKEEPATARSTWSWRSPAKDADTSWEPVPTELEATSSDTVDFSEESQIESLGGDESLPGDVAVAATSVGATSAEGEGQDARQRASDLADELRQLVWAIGVDEAPGAGHKDSIQDMSRVRGETSDFADLATVITAVRENPRDIDALRELGQKAERLQELLDSHGRLSSTLDKAIGDLR